MNTLEVLYPGASPRICGPSLRAVGPASQVRWEAWAACELRSPLAGSGSSHLLPFSTYIRVGNCDCDQYPVEPFHFQEGQE